MRSIAEKVQDLEHIWDISDDLSEWEYSFISSIIRQFKRNNGDTTSFTDKQVDKIDQLWNKHCA